MNIPLCEKREKNAFDVLAKGDFCKQVEHNLNVFIIVKAAGCHVQKAHSFIAEKSALAPQKNIMNREIINIQKCRI